MLQRSKDEHPSVELVESREEAIHPEFSCQPRGLRSVLLLVVVKGNLYYVISATLIRPPSRNHCVQNPVALEVDLRGTRRSCVFSSVVVDILPIMNK